MKRSIMFTGPSGTGKTTMSDAIEKVFNQLNYDHLVYKSQMKTVLESYGVDSVYKMRNVLSPDNGSLNPRIMKPIIASLTPSDTPIPYTKSIAYFLQIANLLNLEYNNNLSDNSRSLQDRTPIDSIAYLFIECGIKPEDLTNWSDTTMSQLAHSNGEKIFKPAVCNMINNIVNKFTSVRTLIFRTKPEHIMVTGGTRNTDPEFHIEFSKMLGKLYSIIPNSDKRIMLYFPADLTPDERSEFAIHMALKSVKQD